MKANTGLFLLMGLIIVLIMSTGLIASGESFQNYVNTIVGLSANTYNTYIHTIYFEGNTTNSTSKNASEASNISTRISKLESNVESLSKKVSELEANINGLNEKISSLENKIDMIHKYAIAGLGISVIAILIAVVAILVGRKTTEKKVAGKIKKK